jgi:hypothetical protein
LEAILIGRIARILLILIKVPRHQKITIGKALPHFEKMHAAAGIQHLIVVPEWVFPGPDGVPRLVEGRHGG